MMIAFTAGSRFQALRAAPTSARIGVSQALSFHGLFNVTVPMPPLTSVRIAALLMERTPRLERYIERRGLPLSNAGLNYAACSASMDMVPYRHAGHNGRQTGSRD